MIDWSPLSPETPLKDVVGSSFLAKGAAAWLVVTVQDRTSLSARFPALPIAAALKGQLTVTSHSTRGFPRQRSGQEPDYLSIQALSVSRGILPQRLVALPTVRHRFLLQPVVDIDGREVTLGQLMRDGLPVSVRRRGAIALADEVRSTWGRMLADIGYRIEYSALFDQAVSPTRAFTAALSQWQDLDRESGDEDAVVTAATALKVAFDTARANAETLGFGHLPETHRGDGRRAANAARLAASATTDGERAAAQSQVVRLLSSLSLYYLPAPDDLPKAIEAR